VDEKRPGLRPSGAILKLLYKYYSSDGAVILKKAIITLTIIASVLFVILFLASVIIGPRILGLFTQTIDIRTKYITNTDTSKIENVISLQAKINESPNAVFEYKFPNYINEKYSSPYYLQLNLDFNDEDIETVVFKKCTINVNGQSTDLLSKNNNEVYPSRHYKAGSYTKSSSNNPIETNRFEKEKILKIYESPDIIIDYYGVVFWNLPIKPEYDNEAKIDYNCEILFKNGTKKALSDDILFKKTIQETKMYSPIFNPN
jgi:hypothetical protein